tara:strand:+ start:463 stop:702 length:240 start_codon:yes stop_codon:yes gene_type:complete
MKELRIHNNQAYLILRRYPIPKFEDGNVLNKDKVKAVRDWIGSDHVLRDQQHFLFCETIQDVEFEELNQNKEDERDIEK